MCYNKPNWWSVAVTLYHKSSGCRVNAFPIKLRLSFYWIIVKTAHVALSILELVLSLGRNLATILEFGQVLPNQSDAIKTALCFVVTKIWSPGKLVDGLDLIPNGEPGERKWFEFGQWCCGREVMTISKQWVNWMWYRNHHHAQIDDCEIGDVGWCWNDPDDFRSHLNVRQEESVETSQWWIMERWFIF